MKKLAALFTAAILLVVTVLPVMAAEGGTEHRYRNEDAIHTPDSEEYLKDAAPSSDSTSGTDNVTLESGILKFNKYLITNIGTTEPDIKFDFTIEPGVAVDYDLGDPTATPPTTGTFAIMKPEVGPRSSTTEPEAKIATANVSAMPQFVAVSGYQVPSTVTTTYDKTTVLFNDALTKYESVPTGSDDTVFLDDREQYQKQQIGLDFSQVYFYEPGVYRYIIKEEATPNGTGYTQPTGLYLDTQEFDTHAVNSDPSDPTSPKVMPDPTEPDNAGSKERILDVYVVDKNDGSGDLVVQTFILRELVGGSAPDLTLGNEAGTNTQNYGTDDGTLNAQSGNYEIEQKSDGFVNEYHTVDLDVKKEVKGNQASRDKYFKLNIKVPGAQTGVNYLLSIADDDDTVDTNTHDGSCDATTGANAATIQANEGKNNYTSTDDPTNPTKYYVAGATLNGTAGFDVYLQHGQHIVIRGLPEGSTYTVTEEPEDYRPYKAEQYRATPAPPATVTNYWNATDPATDTTQNPLKTTLKERDKISDADGITEADTNIDNLVRTSFLNVRDGVIPTGVAIGIVGGLVLLAAVIVYIVLRRRSTVYEEED